MFRNIEEFDGQSLPAIPNAESFTLLIDRVAAKYDIGHFDAIMEFCERTGRDYDTIGSLLSSKLKTRILREVTARRLLKDNSVALDMLD